MLDFLPISGEEKRNRTGEYIKQLMSLIPTAVPSNY